MTNQEIARALSQTADLIELTGGNSFRAQAFSRAARTLKGLDDDVSDRLDEGTLTDISGIGSGMADHIGDLVETGSFELLDELMSAVPPGLLDVLRIKGLGTKKVRTLWKELDIASLEDVEAAAKADRITSLRGFGAKTQEKIIENVGLLRRYDKRRRYADAVTAVTPVLEALRAHDAVTRAEPTGVLRRKLETVDNADLLVAGDEDAVVALLNEHAEDVDASGDTVTGRLSSGLPLTVHWTSPETFGTDWWTTTGSDDHVAAFQENYDIPTAGDEDAIYKQAGLAVVPPELREDDGELDAARDDSLPVLITVDDLHGSLHNHSTYSDGAHTLKEMADAARDLGLSYFGICDHSQSLKVAGGMEVDEVKAQQQEISELNTAYAADDHGPFRIFSGIESDILADGSLDYEEDILASFDFIVASVHTRFNMTEAEATDRIVRAVENPYTRILGHPTGRILLRREGYPLDHQRVIDACAANGVALELNASPYRLDLDWRWVHRAIEAGVLISINPDAHAIGELKNVRWGVEAARKGWLSAEHCLNAKPLNAFTQWVVG